VKIVFLFHISNATIESGREYKYRYY